VGKNFAKQINITKTMANTIEYCEDIIRRAKSAEKKADYVLAMKHCDELRIYLQEHKDSITQDIFYNYDIQALFLNGVIQLKRGNFSNALNILYEALDKTDFVPQTPLRGRVLRVMASLYSEIGETDKALDNAQQALLLQNDTTQPDERGHLYNTIARIYYTRSEYGIAMEYAQKALALFEENGFKEQGARIIGNIGTINFIHGNYSEALEKMFKALEYFESENMPYDTTRFYDAIACVYDAQGKHVIAIEYLLKSLSQREIIDDKVGIAHTLGNLGNVFQLACEYDKAIEYHSRALEMSRSLGLVNDCIRETGNLGSVYVVLKEYATALRFYEEALSQAYEVEHKYEIARLLSNIGQTYKELHDTDKALEYMLLSIEKEKEIDMKLNIAQSSGILGTIYHSRCDYEKAYQYLQESLELSLKIKAFVGIATILKDLADFYSDTNNPFYDIDKAEEYFLQSLSQFTEHQLHEGMSDVMLGMAEFYKNQERWKESAEYFEKYIAIFKKIQSENIIKNAQQFAQSRDIAVMNREKELLAAKNVELEEANSFKTKLMAMAAHDLKNSLSNIKLIAGMLLASETDNEQYELLTMVKESAVHMSNMISSLLESTAAEMGAVDLQKTQVNIKEIVQQSVGVFSYAAKNKKQHFLLDLQECYALVDKERFSQVVDNIISNAIKYSYIETEIHINLRVNDNHIRLAIKDQGQGLSDEDKKHLFTEFKRLSSVPTGNEQSTGLGLYIVKHIIDLHDGTIRVESEGKNKGATFIVEIPAMKE
jgi:signal transduction histidine kinase